MLTRNEQNSKQLTVNQPMFRRWIFAITTLLLSLVLVACNAATTQPNTSSKKVAQRVITLTSLSSDIVYQLDKTKLVGITGSKLFDRDARFKDITRVSQGQTPPNLEKIIALQPDLVVGNKEFHAQILPKLEQLGIATLAINMDKWDDLSTLTKNLAEATGTDPSPLLARYETCLAKPVTGSPTVLVLVNRQPILAPNKYSWAGDLLNKLGAKNLVDDLQGANPSRGYLTLSPEKILEANPDAILIVEQRGQETAKQFKAEPFWGKLKATQNNRVYVFDYYGLVNPGSLNKIEQACTQLRKVI